MAYDIKTRNQLKSFTKNDIEKLRQIMYSGGAKYKCYLTINGKEVSPKQISKINISNPIIDTKSDYMYVGTYIAQKLTIKFKNLDNLDIKSNNEVNLDIGILVDNEYYKIPIGKFLIDDLSENYYETCEISCLDYSIKAKKNIDYSPCFVDGKATIDTILEYICDYFGIELDKNYPRTNGTIETGLFDNTLSGKRYISYISELKGCNAKHGRDGILYLIPIKQGSNVKINALKSKSWELGEKYKITGVTYDDGARIFKAGDNSENTLFIRNDNPFIESQETIDNIYNVVKDTEIYNLKTENYGDITLDPYDNILYQLGDKSYNTLNNIDLTYEMNIMSTNNVSLPTKQQEETTNVVGGNEQSKIIRMGRTIDLINGEIKDLVKKVVDISKTITGVGSINITDSYGETLHKLEIYGYYELPIVGNNIITGEFKVKSNSILTIKQNDEIYRQYKLPFKTLYMVEDTHDTFTYLEGKCYVTRNIGVNDDGTKYILENPYIEEYEDLIIEIPNGNFTISIDEETLHLSATYLLQNEYTDTFATQADVENSIKISSEEILIKSETNLLENGDKLIASINTKSTGEVLIDASKLAEINANKINFNSYDFNVTTQNMKISIGTEENKKDIINANGVLTNLIYTGFVDGNMFVGSGDYIPLGRVGGGDTLETQKNRCNFSFKLPTNFVVESAKVFLSHSPVNWTYNNGNSQTKGYSSQLKLYKANVEDIIMNYNVTSSSSYKQNATYSEIYGAFGSSGFTGSNTKSTSTTSIDIKDYIDSDKVNILMIQDSNSALYTTNEEIFGNTGSVMAYLEVIGYYKV